MLHFRTKWIYPGLATMLLSDVGSAEAKLVKYEFTGTVRVSSGLNTSLFPPNGTPVWGSFMYETETPNIAPPGGQGTYPQLGPSMFNVYWESQSVETTSFDIWVYDSLFDPDQIRFNYGQSNGAGIYITLQDPTRTVFNSVELPTTLDLSDFGGLHEGAVYFASSPPPGGDNAFFYTINTLTRVPVPEPGSMVLAACVGVFGAGVVRMRRR